MHHCGLAGRPVQQVNTPALLLDMDAAQRNIRKMAELFRGRECKLRPHFKTHKLPILAHMQMSAGAVGITCAKLAEAEDLLLSGIENVLIANQIVGAQKIAKLASLARYGRLMVCIDDYSNAAEIARAAGAAGVRLGVLAEVNVGLNRCGVNPGRPALDFVRKVLELPNIDFRGLMGYEGGVFVKDPAEKAEICKKSNALLVETAELIRGEGIPVEVVSSGGSNTINQTGLYPGITDIQVGSYVTMDSHNREFGIDFEQAVFVLSTIISRPESGRAVMDAGKKAFSCDAGMPGFVEPGFAITMLCEEHGILGLAEEAEHLRIGDKVMVIPSHGCTTIPLYDEYIAVRGDTVEAVLPIRTRQTS